MSKLNFPKLKTFTDTIISQREELNEYVDLLYKDRSKINLLKFRRTERTVFLNHRAICRTCHKEKRLANFYDKVAGSISDNCLKCQEKEMVVSIIKNLTKEPKETKNV